MTLNEKGSQEKDCLLSKPESGVEKENLATP
jgi:hypothetical protein